MLKPAAVVLFLLAVPPAVAAECEPREAEGPVTVESCPIDNAAATTAPSNEAHISDL